MLKSMTGYGKAEIKDNNRYFVIEIKSTNSRFCDVKIAMSPEFNEIEQQIIAVIRKIVKRGKVEVFISRVDEEKPDIGILTNYELALTYYKALKSLQQRLDLPDNIDLSMLLRFYQVTEVAKGRKIFTVSHETRNTIINVVENALKNFDDMRTEEGKTIYDDLSGRVRILEEQIKKIEERYKISFNDYKNNLTKKINEIINIISLDASDKTVDKNRIAMEIALLAERSDVSEEITRMKGLICQFSDNLKIEGDQPEGRGRRLDFIIQEINRETNTIGAKCNDSEISGCVIILKEELEKIREQVQNVE